jgi:hypothetical protein
MTGSRVARWFILRPKIPIGVYSENSLGLKMFVYFTAVWYNLLQFGITFDRLV